MCRLLGIRTKPEHTGRSSRHGNSAPGCNAALSRVLKVPNRHLQTPQELHPPLADIRQIEPCAAMMRTPFQHGKRDTRNMIQYARPIQPSWRRRDTEHAYSCRLAAVYRAGGSPPSLPPAPFRLQAWHHIESIQRRAGILSIMQQTNAVQRGVSRSEFQ